MTRGACAVVRHLYAQGNLDGIIGLGGGGGTTLITTAMRDRRCALPAATFRSMSAGSI
jgi:uncharacterized protein (UPF0261 family)